MSMVLKKEGEGRRSNIKKTPKTALFEIYVKINKKSSTSNFLVHGHFSWSTFSLHASQGPKGFKKLHLFKNWTMKV
jgi:hypothetical protein